MSQNLKSHQNIEFNLIVNRHNSNQSITWTFQDLIEEEKSHWAKIKADHKLAFLSLNEVSPTLSQGVRKTLDNDLLCTREEILDRGIQIVNTRRGGRTTYHGPGQWLVFIHFDFHKFSKDSKNLRALVAAYLDCALEVCRRYYPEAVCMDDEHLGIWTHAKDLSKYNSASRKLVSLGISLKDGITQQGLCFNIYPTADSFYGIKPCGLDAEVAYLSESAYFKQSYQLDTQSNTGDLGDSKRFLTYEKLMMDTKNEIIEAFKDLSLT